MAEHSTPSAGPPTAGFDPLTPTAFLDRSAEVFAHDEAVVDGELRLTYAQLRDRCLRQAGMLRDLGVAPGDRVAVLAPNTHLLLEAHYGVLYAGAVLVALNIRLSGPELSYIVEHSGARVLLHDPTFAALATEIAAAVPDITLVDGARYEELLAAAAPLRHDVADERALMSLNYTSGTTGRPKGVMYHHRGAYLQALAMAMHFRLSTESTYLWTLPMFHCNGWCFPWAVAAAGARHLCLPAVDPEAIWRHLATGEVTHFCGAPTVLVMLVNHPDARPLPRPVLAAVGGAPPAPSLLERCAALNLHVVHLYGLTETFGPIVLCEWRAEWDALPEAEQATRRARQGVGNAISRGVRVVDADGRDVPRDGKTMGEVALGGNNITSGYFRDEEATARAIPDGWLRTGDLGVLHPDGYLEIRDRAKDVIISGGENIASVEVEAVLASHPAVLEVAVVAVPDEKWGERPAAWVTLREGADASADELQAHVRERLAGFKVPDRIVFGPLPKTGTGKIKKFVLREEAWKGHARPGTS